MSEIKKSNDNILLNLIFNIVIPSLLLTKGEKFFTSVLNIPATPKLILIIALAFPAGYFIFDYAKKRKVNFISILGFLGTLLSGGIGLLQMSPFWVAIKEAAIPLFIAIFLLVSPKPFYELLYNDKIFNTNAIDKAIKQNEKEDEFKKIIPRCAKLLACSFLLSAILNFVLAKLIVITDPKIDNTKFNEELGEMMALSYPVIVLPSMIFFGFAIYFLIKNLTKTTGLSFENIIQQKK